MTGSLLRQGSGISGTEVGKGKVSSTGREVYEGGAGGLRKFLFPFKDLVAVMAMLCISIDQGSSAR